MPIFGLISKSGFFWKVDFNYDIIQVDTNRTSSFILVPCFALDSVDVALRSRCVSIIPTAFPGYVVRHSNFALFADAIVAPQLPNYFLKDASFLLKDGKLVEGFASFEPINMANYFISMTGERQLKIVERQQTDEYENNSGFAPANGQKLGK